MFVSLFCDVHKIATSFNEWYCRSIWFCKPSIIKNCTKIVKLNGCKFDMLSICPLKWMIIWKCGLKITILNGSKLRRLYSILVSLFSYCTVLFEFFMYTYLLTILSCYWFICCLGIFKNTSSQNCHVNFGFENSPYLKSRQHLGIYSNVNSEYIFSCDIW